MAGINVFLNVLSSDCHWLDIGRQDDYERALAEFSSRQRQALPDEPDGGATAGRLPSMPNAP